MTMFRALVCVAWWLVVTACLGRGIAFAAESERDRLQKIDSKAGTLVVARGYVTMSYHFRLTMEVFINGQAAKIADLKPGMEVEFIESKEPGMATALHAKSLLVKIPQGLDALDPRVNLNTASREQLDSLPGVGPILAEAIVKARPFTRVEDLSRVKGVGPKTLEKLFPLVKAQ